MTSSESKRTMLEQVTGDSRSEGRVLVKAGLWLSAREATAHDYFAMHNGFKTETATKKIKGWRRETGTFEIIENKVETGTP